MTDGTSGRATSARRKVDKMGGTTMQVTQLHDDNFLKILWDENTRTIGIDWKESTSAMTDEQFKAELASFAGFVEQKKARGILVDVSHFRHKMAPDVQEWRVKNISNRYYAAGVQRFAFLLPNGSPIPAMMNQSSPGERFATRAFSNLNEATNWLSEPRQQSAAD
jgi:hypothetical protein